MTRYKDAIVGAVVICVSIVLFIATFGIREFTRTALGAGFVPRIAAVVFFALGVVLIVRNLRANKQAGNVPPQEQPVAKQVGLTGAKAVIVNILLFVIYLLLLETIGFVILTPIYIFLQILILTDPAKHRLGWYALLAVVVSVASYNAFVHFFSVMLPNGILS